MSIFEVYWFTNFPLAKKAIDFVGNTVSFMNVFACLQYISHGDKPDPFT